MYFPSQTHALWKVHHTNYFFINMSNQSDKNNYLLPRSLTRVLCIIHFQQGICSKLNKMAFLWKEQYLYQQYNSMRQELCFISLILSCSQEKVISVRSALEPRGELLLLHTPKIGNVTVAASWCCFIIDQNTWKLKLAHFSQCH